VSIEQIIAIPLGLVGLALIALCVRALRARHRAKDADADADAQRAGGRGEE
jgi:hypothetical protein